MAETVRLRAELSGLSLSEYVRQQLISQARQRRKSEAVDAVEAALDKSPGTGPSAEAIVAVIREPRGD